LLNYGLGEEGSGSPERESDRQSSQQDQSGEVPRPTNGETLRKKDQAAKLKRVSLHFLNHLSHSSTKIWQKKEEARIAQERKEKKWQKDHAYDELFQEADPEDANNQDRGEDFLDDFM